MTNQIQLPGRGSYEVPPLVHRLDIARTIFFKAASLFESGGYHWSEIAPAFSRLSGVEVSLHGDEADCYSFSGAVQKCLKEEYLLHYSEFGLPSVFYFCMWEHINQAWECLCPSSRTTGSMSFHDWAARICNSKEEVVTMLCFLATMLDE